MKRIFEKPLARHLCWISLLLLFWQGIYTSGIISPLLLPSLSDVFASLFDSIINGVLISQILFSLGIILCGLLAALILALSFSALASRSKVMSSLTDTLSMLAHPLPAVAVLPLVIVWFGVGTKAIIIIVIHSVLWPLLVNLSASFRGVRSIYIATGRSLSFGSLRLLLYVYIPASVSALLSGIRIGWARAWRALISAEMIFGAIGGSGGIGWAMFKSRVMMDTPGLFSGILVVIIIGIAMETFLNLIERKTLLRWGKP